MAQHKKKPMKRHITCPKVKFGKKVIFSGPYGSIEVIWRSFGDSKLKAENCNRPSVKKPMKRHITCPKVRFGKEVMFSGSYGSLEVI